MNFELIFAHTDPESDLDVEMPKPNSNGRHKDKGERIKDQATGV